MGIEIERKFLIDHEKWQITDKPAGQKLKQGYMMDEADRTIRLRIADDAAYLTFKSGNKGLSRTEHEYEIPLEEGAELFTQFVRTGLEKTRHCITYAGKLWEIDVFEGENEGLIVAEIELDSEDEYFELPPWVGQEVTGDERYYNSRLSVNPFKTWQNK